VDAVYFQGAVLDPLEIMDQLESEFACPVVASNPAMLWFILSELGHTYHIEGCGRLLREWPTAVAR
jgi:maleate cis-trans isomerase